jgi:hypothetical protein
MKQLPPRPPSALLQVPNTDWREEQVLVALSSSPPNLPFPAAELASTHPSTMPLVCRRLSELARPASGARPRAPYRGSPRLSGPWGGPAARSASPPKAPRLRRAPARITPTTPHEAGAAPPTLGGAWRGAELSRIPPRPARAGRAHPTMPARPEARWTRRTWWVPQAAVPAVLAHPPRTRPRLRPCC